MSVDTSPGMTQRKKPGGHTAGLPYFSPNKFLLFIGFTAALLTRLPGLLARLTLLAALPLLSGLLALLAGLALLTGSLSGLTLAALLARLATLLPGLTALPLIALIHLVCHLRFSLSGVAIPTPSEFCARQWGAI